MVSTAPVNLNQRSKLFLELQRPPAFYHHAATFSRSMHQLAFPSSVLNEFGLDLFQWLRELRLQKIVTNSANGFLSPPTIEFLGAMVPKINSTLYAASHDAIVYELKKIF